MHLYRSIHQQLMKKWVQRFVLFFIMGSILSVILSSFKESAPYRSWLFAFNYLASFIFTIEYLLRIIAAPGQYTNARSTWSARFKYIFSFYGLIDLVAIIPFVVIYVYKESPHVHLIILAYILIIFKLIRYSRSYRLLGRMISTVKDELITAYTACGILVGFSGILMYYIERAAQPDEFKNVGSGIWWAIETFTTVGYGDIYPITPLGRLLGSAIMLIGISMIAVPTAIISSAFMKMIIKKDNTDSSPNDKETPPTDTEEDEENHE
ncbi:ion transporter [uncultured Bacteroides sp.]|uniref:ion transporter n=1 Tax=uncultured Bacteroides sp. TaxID=162156 RepID=UPI00263622AF|nr:ion transporter [uncultured Bacteroides sp.]